MSEQELRKVYYRGLTDGVKTLVNLIYLDEEAYLQDQSPHPIIKYLYEYSENIGDPNAAQTAGLAMGIYVEENTDPDIDFYDTLRLYIETSLGNLTVPLTMRAVLDMSCEDWENRFPDVLYMDRLDHVMKIYYGL